MKPTLNIALIGTGFMGRAHSNALITAPHFFDLPFDLTRRVVCGISDNLAAFASQYGWLETERDWRRVIARPDIDLVDICTANDLHMPLAVAAAQAGKHVLCEKPMALDAMQAREMLAAAEGAGICHMIAFNYRRVPAILLAKNMIESGMLGEIHHFNAVYYQDWLVDPAHPYQWRFSRSQSGSGVHGDLNAHLVDLARFLVGEILTVCAAQQTFIEERPLSDGSGMGRVDVDDACSFLARFENGALGSFQATRFATGRKNFLRFEIFGSRGGLNFNLERLNELEYYSLDDEAEYQGYRTILVTEALHNYIAQWWPPGHIIGWEHTFVHEIVDLVKAISSGQSVSPDFREGFYCQLVLDAAARAAREGNWVSVTA